MKNVWFSLFGLVALSLVFLTACNKEEVVNDEDLMMRIAASEDRVEVPSAELPVEITEFVERNYAPLSVDIAYRISDLGYEIELDDAQDLYFRLDNLNCIGDGTRRGPHPRPNPRRCIRGEEIGLDQLPVEITEYIESNYPDANILLATVKNSGVYAVAIGDATVLLFTPNGTFIKACEFAPDWAGPRCLFGEEVGLDVLPQIIQTRIANRFPNNEIVKIIQKPNGWFVVQLDDDRRPLVFKPNGRFLGRCGRLHPFGHDNWPGGEEIDVSDLSQEILDYLSTYYPDTTVAFAFERRNGAIFLILDDQNKLLFNADGEIVFDSGN